MPDKFFREIFCMKSLLPEFWFFFLPEQIQSNFFKVIIFEIFSNTSVESNIVTNWQFCYSCPQSLIIFWSNFQIIIIVVLIIFINWFKNTFEILWFCGWRLLFWWFGKKSRSSFIFGNFWGLGNDKSIWWIRRDMDLFLADIGVNMTFSYVTAEAATRAVV